VDFRPRLACAGSVWRVWPQMQIVMQFLGRHRVTAVNTLFVYGSMLSFQAC